MRRSRTLLLALGLSVCWGGSAFAQPAPPIRGHVFLPRTHGATVLSTYIDAEARRLVALGDLMESAAIARRIHTDADREAMKNAILWVETYFERKKLYQKYILEQNPIYIDQQQQRDSMKRRLIVTQPEEVLNGEFTDQLNWLLDRLVTNPTTYTAILGGSDELRGLDRPLDASQIAHINLRQATGQQGGGQSFRADAARLLHPEWPLVFARSEFGVARHNFESARDLLLTELDDGRATFASWQSLQAAHDDLLAKFEEIYNPQSLRSYTGNQSIAIRRAGKDFLRNLEAAIAVAFTADNSDVFAGHYRFSGDSLLQLVRHCADHGLEFAPPQNDDKPTYRTLFIDLRQVYLHFYPNASE